MSQIPPNGKVIPVNDLNIYYEEYGSGKPIVLLHGGFSSSSSWAGSIPAFAENYRVIALDSRAHGRTNNPQGRLSYKLMAEDTAAFCKALGLEKPALVGWSDGGQIALEIGMNFPELASGLVVGGAWYKLSEHYLNSVKDLGYEAPNTLNVEVFNAFLDNLGIREEFESPHHHGEGYLLTLAQQLVTPFLTDLNYSAEDFCKILASTLILMGDRDFLIPLEQAFDMYRQIPNAELAVSPNTSHGFPMSHTERFNSLVLDFLQRHTAL
jgi:pimeloyl-ACP methyl ester carboxylesterase